MICICLFPIHSYKSSVLSILFCNCMFKNTDLHPGLHIKNSGHSRDICFGLDWGLAFPPLLSLLLHTLMRNCLRSKNLPHCFNKVSAKLCLGFRNFSFQLPFHLTLIRLYRCLCGFSTCCLSAPKATFQSFTKATEDVGTIDV